LQHKNYPGSLICLIVSPPGGYLDYTTSSNLWITTAATAIPTSSGDPGYIATTSLLPTASGTIQGCSVYRNYDSVNGLNDCSNIAYAYDVTIDQLLAWNPSLSSNFSACDFQSGYSYCVLQSEETGKPSVRMELAINTDRSSDRDHAGLLFTNQCHGAWNGINL
jgi:hypothetical protein